MFVQASLQLKPPQAGGGELHMEVEKGGGGGSFGLVKGNSGKRHKRVPEYNGGGGGGGGGWRGGGGGGGGG